MVSCISTINIDKLFFNDENIDNIIKTNNSIHKNCIQNYEKSIKNKNDIKKNEKNEKKQYIKKNDTKNSKMSSLYYNFRDIEQINNENIYLWITYIIQNSFTSFEYIDPNKYFKVENIERFQWIDIFNNIPKKWFRSIKVKKEDIINDLGSSPKVSIDTIIAVSSYYNKNLIIKTGCYYQVFKNYEGSELFYIIDIGKNFINLFNENHTISKMIELCGYRMFEVDNINKPIKSLSFYKKDLLIDLYGIIKQYSQYNYSIPNEYFCIIDSKIKKQDLYDELNKIFLEYITKKIL